MFHETREGWLFISKRAGSWLETRCVSYFLAHLPKGAGFSHQQSHSWITLVPNTCSCFRSMLQFRNVPYIFIFLLYNIDWAPSLMDLEKAIDKDLVMSLFNVWGLFGAIFDVSMSLKLDHQSFPILYLMNLFVVKWRNYLPISAFYCDDVVMSSLFSKPFYSMICSSLHESYENSSVALNACQYPFYHLHPSLHFELFTHSELLSLSGRIFPVIEVIKKSIELD